MRIKELTIYGFGKFHDTRLTFDKQLQLLYGPNEAGKSTLVAFITSMLFGFATAKHKYEMYQPKSGATYGGEMTFSHQNHDYWLKRVDGTHGGDVTFRDTTTDTLLTKQDLNALLRPVDRELFSQIYGFSEQNLQAVFGLDRFALIQRIQRIGAIGSDDWITLNQRLRKEADAIYKPRGRKQPLSEKLREYDALTEKVAAAKADYPRYQDLQTKESETAQALAACQSAITNQDSALTNLNQIEQLYPYYKEYQAFKNSEQAAPQSISTEDWENFTRLTTQRAQLTARLKTEKEQLASQREDMTPSEPQHFYQAHQTEINQLVNKLPAAQQQLRDRQLAEQNLTAEAQTLDQLRADHGAKLMQTPPMNASDQDNVAQLLAEQRQLNATQTAISNQRHQLADQLNAAEQADNDAGSGISIKWLVAGIAVVVLAVFFLSGVARSVGGALGVIVAAYGIFKPMLNNGDSGASRADLLSEQIDQLNDQLKTVNTHLTDISEQLQTIGSTYHLSAVQVSDWLDLQPVLKDYAAAMARSEADQQRLFDLEARLDQYLTQWQVVGKWLDLHGDRSAQLTAIQQFVNARQDETKQLQLAAQQQRLSDQRVAAQTKEAAAVTQKLAAFLAERDLADEVAFQRAYEASQNYQQQTAHMAMIKQQLTSVDPGGFERYASQAAIDEAKDDLSKQLAKSRLSQAAQLKRHSQLTYDMAQLASSETYQHLLQQRAALEAEITDMTDTWLAKTLLIKWIDQTLIQASQGRQPQIMTAATTYFALLTGDRFHKITFTDDTVTVEDAAQITYDVGELSRGTAEQLYVALRFAFTKVMADEIELPIIIDDSFVNFDRDRTKNAFALLKQLQQTTQILYFTADRYNRELVPSEQCLNLDQLAVE